MMTYMIVAFMIMKLHLIRLKFIASQYYCTNHAEYIFIEVSTRYIFSRLHIMPLQFVYKKRHNSYCLFINQTT